MQLLCLALISKIQIIRSLETRGNHVEKQEDTGKTYLNSFVEDEKTRTALGAKLSNDLNISLRFYEKSSILSKKKVCPI
jgi:hypothetical protein